jgi:hypothetical protein
MKIVISFYCLILVGFVFTSCNKNSQTMTALNSFATLASQFDSPPAPYRPAPLWVWNDRMSREQITEQLEDFHAKGLGGVFVHPRPGLITPYLSDEWHALFRHTVQTGKKLGMKVWIYDENSYPSGFAGGHVPDQMPESYQQGQGLAMHRVSVWPDSLSDSFFCAFERNQDNEWILLQENPRPGQQGDYTLIEKRFYRRGGWFGGFSYVDLLLPGVTEKFLEITMQGYEQHCSDEFGKTMPGVFTDEPNISPPGDIKWTPDLFERFKERWGYDLQPLLLSLWLETGDWKRIRHNYYALLLELFIDRWSKPWYDYCEEKGLEWTGHYWEHGWPSPRHGSDNMAMYAWHQMPGIDILMNQYRTDVNAQFGNVRAVKQVRSAANQTGRRRTLSETYGAGGWELRFEDMKRIADWQFVLGVNYVNPHLNYATIKGARKRDHPQSFSYHAPWWQDYRLITDYTARLSLAMSVGKQENHILVLEPTTTAWMYYSRPKAHEKLDPLGEQFQDFVRELENNQVEYDLGSENIISHLGSVKNHYMIVGHSRYDTIVLPQGTENLDRTTVDLLKAYLKNQGKIISVGSLPHTLDGKETAEIKELADQYRDQWQVVDSSSLAIDLLTAKSSAIEWHLPQHNNGILYHHRRMLQEGELLLLTNTSLTESSQGYLKTDGQNVLELDPVTGKISEYSFTKAGDKVSLRFELPPAGSLLLFFSDEKTSSDAGPKKEPVPMTEIEPVYPTKVMATHPNMLILDYCHLTLEGREQGSMYFFQAADKIFKHFGLENNPWSRAVQFKDEILQKNDFPANKGFSVEYIAEIDGANPDSCFAVVERPECWQLEVNGTVVEPLPDSYWLDKAFGKYAIGPHLKQGKNHLVLRADQMTIHSELEPIYLLGDFKLQSQEHGWTLVESKDLDLGPWNHQGLDCYSEAVDYEQFFNIQDLSGQTVVRLGEWQGTLAKVYVNEKFAGHIAWHPYELDVTDHIRNGTNRIVVRVVGSLKNLLGPHHNNPPRGAAWPAQFEAAPETQPAGQDYDTIAYGLNEPFKLLRKAREL